MIVSRLGPWRLWVFNAFFVCFVHIIRADSVVTAWGRDDYGQTNVPPDITNAVAISSGAFHQLALLPDGTVRAWGADYAGQSDVPAGLGKVMAVAAGGAHSLALLTNGTV
ncbi:MAG TPA: hypothetical protein VFF11_13520, partial [Candidatus Binatia bacterium]|nr:hypothetical protein [Candidatus Binatia bacterium]